MTAGAENGPREIDLRLDTADLSELIVPLCLGGGAAGLLYVAVSFPVLVEATSGGSLALIDALLFRWVPPAVQDAYLPLVAIDWLDPAMRPFVASLGVLYGITGLSIPLLYLAARTEGVYLVGVQVAGLMGGYGLTVLAGGLVSEVAGGHVGIRLSYLVLCFFALEGLKGLTQAAGIGRAKYEVLFDGLFGIVSTALLVTTFESRTLDLFGGPLFLVFVFLSMAVGEQLLARTSYAFLFGSRDAAGQAVGTDPSGTSGGSRLASFARLARVLWEATPHVWRRFRDYSGEDVSLHYDPADAREAVRRGIHSRDTIVLASMVATAIGAFPLVMVAVLSGVRLASG